MFGRLILTFVGRNVLMTSLSCDVVPPGALEIWRELPLGVEEPGPSISMGVEAIIAVGFEQRLHSTTTGTPNEAGC